MKYEEFENEIKLKLNNKIGPRLLLKIINSPYRYYSLLNPFDFKIKLKQSFLRTQENDYFKYINQLIDLFFAQKGYQQSENLFLVKNDNKEFLEEENNQEEYVKIRFNHSYLSEEEIIFIWQRKRDDLSIKKADELFENCIKQISLLIDKFKDKKIKFYLWFMEDNFVQNKFIFNELCDKKAQLGNNIKFNVFYGSELFKEFADEEFWISMEINQTKFKLNNQNLFNELPNLDTDPETYEFMLTLSNSAWEKLISQEKIYIEIRKQLFDLHNPDSNFFKVLKERKID
ncbi:HpyAIV family type II restriction enzyme [Mycoplasmopsis meleagridis]|uniref:HpyAIV family type II restriction enzyme n=1 Tax=Mycoplasmopsis meleagridis TaxID=29561 RepID=UPI003A8A37E6